VPFQVDFQVGNRLEDLHVLVEVAVLSVGHVDVGGFVDKDKSFAAALREQVIEDRGFLFIEPVIRYCQLKIFESVFLVQNSQFFIDFRLYFVDGLGSFAKTVGQHDTGEYATCEKSGRNKTA
jgi:hypothetical protein